MAILRILFVCAMAFGLSNCRKKSDSVGKEVREAGYSMTPEGWFGAVGDDDAGVMRRMTDGGFDMKVLDAEGNGAMHVAAASGAREAAEFLLDKGFPIDAKGAKGRTPLMAAVMAGRPDMVQWLLRQGADPKPKDDGDFMALMLAVTSGARDCVAELAPYHREDLDSALLLAALVGEAEVIDELTNYGASVYARMDDGRTPLMLAAQNGHKEATELLIDIGASRYATLESGDTAQSLAVAAGHAELAELIEKGFSGDVLALDSEEVVAEQMAGYLDENQLAPVEPGEEDTVAANDPGNEAAVPWNKPLAGEGGGQLGMLPPNEYRRDGDAIAGAGKEPVRSLGGATVSRANTARREKLPDGIGVPGRKETADPAGVQARAPVEELPLVMRHYRQRELPVEVKKVSGGVASLHLAGAQPREIQVSGGDPIPGSDLVVVKVFSRTEQGKLNAGQPIAVGVVEVEDKASGLRREWLEGRPAASHDPVAMVEDSATGRRYVAKPGQKFSSEDGRVFIVNDVRPAQLVIEDEESGEVRTLRLSGPRG